MKTLRPNNRNPKTGLRFSEVEELLLEAKRDGEDTVRVGNHTTASFMEDTGENFPTFIIVNYHDVKIINLFDDGSVQLFDGGHKNLNTRNRMDWALIPLGYRLVKIRNTWKVYHPKTGSYRDYFAGMVVQP